MIKKALKFIGAAFVALILIFVIAKTIGDARYFDNYDASLPTNVEIKSTTDINQAKDVFGVQRQQEFKRTALYIDARAGDRVPCILTQPPGFDGKSKLPTIIFVHGSGQRKDFVEEICTPFNKAGFNMISYDQWNCGERKVQSTVGKITAWYDRGWRAVNDARRIADYLVTRDDVDPDRLYLVGASYGAMTSTHILALDKRFKAGVLVVGGGDFKIMLNAPLIRNNVPHALLAVVQPIARWLGAAFDPIRSAAAVGPMPVLMQNGSDDTLVSPDAGKALYAALGVKDKEIRWYPVDHPGLRKGDGPEIVHMLDDGLAWLAVKAGLPAPAALASAAPAPAATPAAQTN